MGATWEVARAAVRSRRTQTVLIGVIVTLCAATLLVGMALLAAVDGPFDRTFTQLHGAHATVLFDVGKIGDDRVAATTHAEGVAASAGPFPVALAQMRILGGLGVSGPLRIVGRAEPGGPVDELKLVRGRWASGPGEIVLGSQLRLGRSSDRVLGQTFSLPGLGTVTAVGIAYSVTQTADAWVRPDDARRVGVTGTEMLYRFDPGAADTAGQLTQRLAAVTAGLPPAAVSGSGSYLTIRERAGQDARTISSFLSVFAGLSLVIAILVIANVVSGAVIAGFRSIGVLKAVGFTPAQVTAVYLLMMTGPALVGALLGAALGNLGASWLLGQFGDTGYVLGLDTTASPALTVAVLVAIPALVALTALVPALRAGRQPATAALSGMATRSGGGRAVQRALSRSRLPRTISLGLALPVVRPARTLLTLVAIVLGSATLVFSTGLVTSAQRWNAALLRTDHVQVEVISPPPGGPPSADADEEGRRQPQGTRLTGAGVEAFLRTVPGARYVTSVRQADAVVGGLTETVPLTTYHGDSAQLGFRMLAGRWFTGPGEAVVGAELLRLTGKSVGDVLPLSVAGRTISVRIVGEAFGMHSGVHLDRASVPLPSGDPAESGGPLPESGGPGPERYLVGLEPGVTATQFIDRVATGGNTGLLAVRQHDDEVEMAPLLTVIGALTLALLVLAGLGVAYTVVLNTRERRRDLAIVKAVGMTPGQAVVMVVTSMAALGIIGGILGLPGGVAAQQEIIRLIGESENTGLPRSIVDVYAPAGLAVLLLGGVVIAVLGALLPARQAARISTAAALHTE